MIQVAIVGASGYTGAALAQLLWAHPDYQLSHLFVSCNSLDRGKTLAQLYPTNLAGELTLQPLSEADAKQLHGIDAVCLAVEHEVAAQLAPILLAQGITVFDLSGGHRFCDPSVYPQFYQFEHPSPEWLQQAVYGLAEWQSERLASAQLIAVPGCYPTASLLALKPLAQQQLIAPNSRPVINATSGVSGAGRKASMTNAFCEVSLTPYGVLNHRHQPEIEQQLGHQVIFTPHLGAFKRGILATITVQTTPGVTAAAIEAAYACYQGSSIVRLLPAGQWPKVDDVAYTNQCLLNWKFDAERQVLVVCSAIDNVLKGAASQAVQCMDIRFLGKFQ